MMYHIKELMNPNSAIPDIASEVEAEREMPILSKIRFGELEVGDKFVFDGFWLVKTSEYHAESDKKRGKSHYLFFKKDVVRYKPLKEKLSNEMSRVSSDQLTKSPCEIVINADTRHVEVWEGEDYMWWTTIDGDLNRSWSVPICLRNLNLTLMYSGNKIMLGFLDEKSIHSDMTIIWERPFDGWDGIHNCTITIKDIKIESED